jgi:hypothetical protein
VHGNKAERKKKKRADYLLRYTRDFPIAVTEAKAEYKKAADGLQQSKDYAEILGLKFAYATNGSEIIEFDFITGIERFVETFPTPAELWARLRAHEKLTDDSAAQRLLTPANLTAGKEPRYYQRIAIDRAVQAILLLAEKTRDESGPRPAGDSHFAPQRLASAPNLGTRSCTQERKPNYSENSTGIARSICRVIFNRPPQTSSCVPQSVFRASGITGTNKNLRAW